MKKLDNIATGEVFKNYSALCTALDEPQKTGKSKQINTFSVLQKLPIIYFLKLLDFKAINY